METKNIVGGVVMLLVEFIMKITRLSSFAILENRAIQRVDDPICRDSGPSLAKLRDK
jgi:hypothetical protein